MSFKEWLHSTLIQEGVIDDDFDDDFDFDQLMTETELSHEDYEQYKEEFNRHCESIGQTPIWDVED